jgi:hypothetical protein
VAADYPKGKFSDYLAALRVARRQRPLTASELDHLRELWQTAEDDYFDPRNWRESRQLAREGVFFIPPRPPAWELLDVELGPPAEPEHERRADELLEQVLVFQTREQPPPKLKPGPKPREVSAKTKRRVAELRIAGAGVAKIMRDTGLTKTVATRLVQDVDEALGTIRAVGISTGQRFASESQDSNLA